MHFLEDVMHQLASCQSAVCLGWHAALVVGALALGLWLARELSVPVAEDGSEAGKNVAVGTASAPREPDPVPESVVLEAAEEPVTPEPGWLGLPPESATEVVLIEEPEPPVPVVSDDGPRPGGRLASSDRERLFAAAMAALGVPDEAWEAPASLAAGEPGVGGETDLARPTEVGAPDDLTLVRGICRSIEEGLAGEGIRTYADLAECPADRWGEITENLGLGDAAAAGGWVTQARELARLVAAIRNPGARAHRPPREISAALLDGWFAEEGIRQDPKLGAVYGARPAVTDRLTDLEGVTEEWAAALGRIGIYRFKQIAHWTDGQVGEVADRLAIPREVIDEGAWVARAMLRHLDTYRASPIWPMARPAAWRYEELLNQYPIGDGVETDERFGVMYLRAPEVRDDLAGIAGIDPGLAAWLGSCGVYRFRQIADWSEANVEAFAARLDLPPERIYSERWIPQATALAAGGKWRDAIGAPGNDLGVEVGEGFV